MFKTTVKYTDFLGGEREETLRFNLTEVELQDLVKDEVAFDPAFLGAIAKEQDPVTMFKIIRKLILHAYGEISEDGRIFRKSEQIMSDFAHSMAYEAFLEQMLSGDEENVSSFMLGVFPAKVAEEMKKQGIFNQKTIPMNSTN